LAQHYCEHINMTSDLCPHVGLPDSLDGEFRCSVFANEARYVALLHPDCFNETA